MTVIGSAYMEILPETDSFGQKLGSLIKDIPVAGKIAAIGIAVGAALVDVGQKYEEMNNTIIQKTGATGDTLKGLEASAKTVFGDTLGATFSNVGDTISELSVRTGLAGKSLDDYAQKQIQLGLVTKTDVGANVQTTTALFNQFGIAASKQSGQLDVLFKASQQSGVGFQQFASTLQSVAPTAQIMGLSIDQAAALTANLSKAGLPAQQVMRGLSSEFQKAAKAGKDPTTAVTDLINQLKAAPDSTSAAEIAMGKFGLSSRSAATFVDAVRNGTFNFAQTLSSITNGQGGINATANATATLGEKFALLKNKALNALEPIATKFLDFVTLLVDKIGPAVSAVSGFIKDLVYVFKIGWGEGANGVFEQGSKIERIFYEIGGAARHFATDLSDIFGTVKQAIELFFGAFTGQGSGDVSKLSTGLQKTIIDLGATASGLYDKIKPVFEWIRDNIKPILIGVGIAVGAIVAPWLMLAAGVIYAYTHFKIVREVIGDVVDFFVNKLIPAVSGVVGFIVKLVSGLVSDWASRWGEIKTIVKTTIEIVAGIVYGVFKAIEVFWNVFHATILRVLKAAWDEVKLVIETAVNLIRGIVDLFLDLFTGHWSKAWHDLLGILSDVWKLIGGTISNALSIVGNLLASLGGIILRALEHLPDLAVQGLKLLGGFLLGLAEKLPDIAAWFLLLPVKIVGFLVGIDAWLLEKGVELLTGFLNGIINKLPDVANWFLSLPGKILDFLVTIATLEIRGVEILAGFIAGLVSKVPEVLNWFLSLPSQIQNLLASAINWLVNAGEQIIQGLINGIGNMIGKVVDAVGKVVDAAKNAVTSGFHILSPSRVFHDYGTNLMQGLANGISDSLSLPTKALQNLNLGASLPGLASGASGGTTAAGAAAAGLGGSGGAAPAIIHIHPQPGQSEEQIGRITAARVAWQGKPTSTGSH